MDLRYLHFSEDEIKAISSKIINLAEKDDRKWLICRSLLHYGITIAELITVQKQDVCWKENFIRVTYREGNIKKVPFEEMYRKRLERYFSSRNDTNPALFVKKSGKNYLRPEIKHLLEPLSRKCGLVYPIDSYFCKASSILYQLPLRKSLTETANIVGFQLIAKLIYFIKKGRLISPNTINKVINPIPITDEQTEKIAQLKELIFGDDDKNGLLSSR